MISAFQEKLETFQKECESRLNREIDEKLFRQCSEMLERYTTLIRQVLADIQIEG